MSGLSVWALGMFVRVHDAVYQRSGGWIGHRIRVRQTACCCTPSAQRPDCRAPTRCPMPETGRTIWSWPPTAVIDVPRPGITASRPIRGSRSASAPNGSGHGLRGAAGDPDYARLWRIVNANNADRYDAYQARTTRYPDNPARS